MYPDTNVFVQPYVKNIYLLVTIQNRNNIILFSFNFFHICMIKLHSLIEKQTNKQTNNTLSVWILSPLYSQSWGMKQQSKFYPCSGRLLSSVLLPWTADEDSQVLHPVCRSLLELILRANTFECTASWDTVLNNKMIRCREEDLECCPYQTVLACNVSACLTWICSTS